MGLLEVSILAGNLKDWTWDWALKFYVRERIIGGCWVRAIVTLVDIDMERGLFLCAMM